MYYSSGTQWDERASATEERNFQMERRDKGADIVLVASEPLTFERGSFSLFFPSSWKKKN
jgi:glutamine amidotransferase